MNIFNKRKKLSFDEIITDIEISQKFTTIEKTLTEKIKEVRNEIVFFTISYAKIASTNYNLQIEVKKLQKTNELLLKHLNLKQIETPAETKLVKDK